jgi:hypothetical protein
MNTQNEYKKVWNFFFISQWREEEKWLNDMAREGWHLVHVNALVRYVFKRGTPREFIYKLDLPENLPHGLGREEYYNFLTECGIRIVCEKKQWIYLQKRTADGPFDADDDMFAKLRITNKVYGYAIRNMCRLLRAFTIIIILNLCGASIAGATMSFAATDFFSSIAIGVGIGAITALTFIFVPIITKLRKQMNETIDELGVRH